MQHNIKCNAFPGSVLSLQMKEVTGITRIKGLIFVFSFNAGKLFWAGMAFKGKSMQMDNITPPTISAHSAQ